MPYEHIIYRKGKVPALNYSHPDLSGLTPKQIESAALKKKPTMINVNDIVAIGNHLSEHFDDRWNPLHMGAVPEELREKHSGVLKKHSGMNQILRDAGVLADKHMKTLAFKSLHARVVKLPDGKYAAVGGVYRVSWAKILGAKELSARVVDLKELK